MQQPGDLDRILRNNNAFSSIFISRLTNAAAQPETAAVFEALGYRLLHEKELSATLDPMLAERLSNTDPNVWGTKDLGNAVRAVAAEGLTNYPKAVRKAVGAYRVAYHPFRGLRPADQAAEQVRVREPRKPTDRSWNGMSIHEQIARGSLLGVESLMLFNLYPQLPWHFLLSPQQSGPRPQFATDDDLRWAWEIVRQSAIDDLYLLYNSSAAHASMPDIHFQGTILPEGFPVEAPHWRHHGGDHPYPIGCAVTHDTDELAAWVGAMQRLDIPHNVAIAPGPTAYCFARRSQGNYQIIQAEPKVAITSGIAIAELMGMMCVPSARAYELLAGPQGAGLIALQLEAVQV